MTPKNSYTKLVRLVRRGNLHEANIVFADIMQQKSVDRLNEERKTLVAEDEDRPRCKALHKNGAQCVLKPGHTEKHQSTSGDRHVIWESISTCKCGKSKGPNKVACPACFKKATGGKK